MPIHSARQRQRKVFRISMVGRADHKEAVRLEEFKAEPRKGPRFEYMLDDLCAEDGVQRAFALLQIKRRSIAGCVRHEEMDVIQMALRLKDPALRKIGAKQRPAMVAEMRQEGTIPAAKVKDFAPAWKIPDKTFNYGQEIPM